jgi:hypothetical protein
MTTEEFSREDAVALLKAGFGRALCEAAAQYAMPICWIAAEKRKPLILANGSAFMLDAGQGPMLVTADHVFEDFLASRAVRPDAVCVLGEVVRFPLEERLLARDPVHDVATFRLTAADVEEHRRTSVPKVVLTGSQTSWPPNPPEMERGVFFVGFPGDGRSMRLYRGGGVVEIDWEGYSALAIASSVSDTGITLVLEHDPELDISHRPTVPKGMAMGGCSGAPLLTLVRSEGVTTWRLGGIINEASSTIVKASRADCIKPDGTLNPHPDPNAYISVARKRAHRMPAAPAAVPPADSACAPDSGSPPSAARGRDVPLPELLELLKLCVRAVETAVPHLRFDPFEPSDRFLVGLLSQMVAYAQGVRAVGAAGTYALIPGATRSAIYAYVDIANLCDHSTYWKTLMLADAISWSAVLQASSRGCNAFLQAITDSDLLIPGRSYYAELRRRLEQEGVRRMEVKERFEQAGLTNEHESAYALMSADTHNNVSAIVVRYFNTSEESITLRRPDEERLSHYELPCTLLVSEMLLRAAEKVLRHFGHGIAMLSEANELFFAITREVSGTEPPENNRSRTC